LALIVLATFGSEDLTGIAVGLLVRHGRLDLFVGLISCFVGIVAGDLGLWLIGRLMGVGLLHCSWLGRLLPRQGRDELGAWFDRHGPAAVLAVRFLPGARLPLYLAAGFLGRDAARFALWVVLAALLWTPLLVVATILLGEVVAAPFTALGGAGWPAPVLGAVGLFVAVRFVSRSATLTGRRQLWATVSRLWRWEFWPSWLFYLPLLPWLAWLSVRHRGALVWTAANPGIPHGGVVGESKSAILDRLPSAWTLPAILVPPGPLAGRLAVVQQALAERGWSFPLILKPDAGQRGVGVQRAGDLALVEHYLQEHPDAVIVQVYHPGPFEAGVFYYRVPGEATGHIFSITDKVFPVVVGDGVATIEELIWAHPRYRMQARTFLDGHDGQRDRVLEKGERFILTLAGNHCQGTLFHDGAHLITAELERSVDAIARQFPGFYIGRFDIRYRDIEDFRAGRDLGIVELNGATSESTNLYDPSRSLFAAYSLLYRQWSLLYRIGAANRQEGHLATGAWALMRLVWGYYRSRRIEPCS
jgi:membrane protein DedA with SNARE-associated domain